MCAMSNPVGVITILDAARCSLSTGMAVREPAATCRGHSSTLVTTTGDDPVRLHVVEAGGPIDDGIGEGGATPGRSW